MVWAPRRSNSASTASSGPFRVHSLVELVPESLGAAARHALDEPFLLKRGQTLLDFDLVEIETGSRLLFWLQPMTSEFNVSG